MADGGTLAVFTGSQVRDFTIRNEITANAPAGGYAVPYPLTQQNCVIDDPTGKIKWNHGTLGYPGRLANHYNPALNPPSLAPGVPFESAITFFSPLSSAEALLSVSFSALPAGVSVSARATGTTTGFIQFINHTGAAIDPAVGVLRVSEVLV